MLTTIARDIAAHGGRAFYTGGYVRDYLLRGEANEEKDIDIEVFALHQDQLLSILDTYGGSLVVKKREQRT